MRNKPDLRQVILRDFYLENLQSMINHQQPQPHECEEEEKGADGYGESEPQQMQIFDSMIIKDCVLRAR
jgi:hypothetical protein